MCKKIYEEVRSFISISSEQNISLFKISCLKYFVWTIGQEVSIHNRNKWHGTDSIDYRTYEARDKLLKNHVLSLHPYLLRLSHPIPC